MAQMTSCWSPASHQAAADTLSFMSSPIKVCGRRREERSARFILARGLIFGSVLPIMNYTVREEGVLWFRSKPCVCVCVCVPTAISSFPLPQLLSCLPPIPPPLIYTMMLHFLGVSGFPPVINIPDKDLGCPTQFGRGQTLKPYRSSWLSAPITPELKWEDGGWDVGMATLGLSTLIILGPADTLRLFLGAVTHVGDAFVRGETFWNKGEWRRWNLNHTILVLF